MVLVQFLVVLLFLYIGMRVGGIGVGFAGGAGVIVLSALGATPGGYADAGYRVYHGGDRGDCGHAGGRRYRISG